MNPLPEHTSVLLYTNMVLPIGWVNSLEFFCAASETVTDNMNVFALEPNYTFVVYPQQLGRIRLTTVRLPLLKASSTYMSIWTTYFVLPRGDPNQKKRVSKLTIRVL